MKFRKKPVVIEAEQFFENSFPWPVGVEQSFVDDSSHGRDNGQPNGFKIQTLEGPYLGVVDGDWIITGVKGERYPCKPDIFAMTYEAV